MRGLTLAILAALMLKPLFLSSGGTACLVAAICTYCCCAYRTQNKDGQTITVTFPKQDDCLINNQLESLTFKVCLQQLAALVLGWTVPCDEIKQPPQNSTCKQQLCFTPPWQQRHCTLLPTLCCLLLRAAV